MNALPEAVRRYMDGLKTHDVEQIADTVADDLAFVTPAAKLSKTQFLAMLRALYAGFPDWHYDHDEPVVERDPAEGDLVTVRWRQGGTHTGVFAWSGHAPVAATHRKVSISTQPFYYRVRGDKIVEIRPEPMAGGAPRGILEQIGVAMPAV